MLLKEKQQLHIICLSYTPLGETQLQLQDCDSRIETNWETLNKMETVSNHMERF